MTLAEHSATCCYPTTCPPIVVTCLSSKRPHLSGGTPPPPWAQRPTYIQALLMAPPSHGVLFCTDPEHRQVGEVCGAQAKEMSAGASTEGHWVMVGTGSAAMSAAGAQVWGTCGDVAEALRQHRSQQNQQKWLQIYHLHHSSSLCSSNLLQSTSNDPSNFSKTRLAWAKLQLLQKKTCHQKGSVKNAINYKCLSVTRKPSIWPSGQQIAGFSSQAHPNRSCSSHLFLWRKV